MSSPTGAERVLGEYRLGHRIAVGGMAEVFEARHRHTEQRVVLKVLLPQLASDGEFVAMFADEARLAMKLEHTNLVRVHHFGQQGAEHFIVMEHVEGPTLSQLLARVRGGGAMPSVPVALHIGSQLLEALRYLHGLTDDTGAPLEAVHRDVTPGNVLLTVDGAVKLGDMGIARHRLRTTRTRTGVIKGTVQYMAPEQVTGSTVDGRADLYGVALILFELLTGRPFISAEREVELIKLAENPPWTAPSRVRAELDPALDELLRPALARFPEQRYPDAESFLAALSRTRARLGAEPEPPGQWIEELQGTPVSTVLPQPADRPATVRKQVFARRRRWPVMLIPLLGALLLVAIWIGIRAGEPGLPAAVPDAAVVSTPDTAPGSDVAADLAMTEDQAVEQPAKKLKRRARIQMSRRPKASPADAGPAPRPSLDVSPAGPTVEMVERRYGEALRRLRARGILPGDLPHDLRARAEALRKRLAAKDMVAAGGILEGLERSFLTLQLNRTLVEAKLKRVDALLRRQKGQLAERLRRQAGQALQEFMDGRYATANRHLNQILGAISDR